MNLDSESIKKRVEEYNKKVRNGEVKDPYMEVFKAHPLMTKFAFWYIDKFLSDKK